MKKQAMGLAALAAAGLAVTPALCPEPYSGWHARLSPELFPISHTTQRRAPVAGVTSPDEGRRWLDQQFVSLECEPLRATGKVLLADKLVVVAREARNRPELFDNEDWRNSYALAAHAVLSKPLIRVDVPAMSISY